MQNAETVHVETITSIRDAELRSMSIKHLLAMRLPPDPSTTEDLPIPTSPLKRYPENGKYKPVLTDWTRLQTLRSRVQSLRRSINDHNDKLRRIQDSEREADNAYLSLVRRKQVAGEDLDQEIQSAFERLEGLRLEFSDTDEENVSLRRPFGAAENEQMKMEHHFYKNFERLAQRDPNKPLRWTPFGSSDRSSRRKKPRKYVHPLYLDYRSRVSHFWTLNEEFGELENEMVALRDEKEFRARIGRTLLPEDDDFLTRYPTEAQALLASIEAAREEIAKAKFTCLEAGVWQDTYSSDSSTDEEYDVWYASSESSVDSEMAERQANGAEVEDSIRLERVSKETQEKSPKIASSSRSPSQFLKPTQNNSDPISGRFVDYVWDKKTSTGNYVNLWLLHRLRSSPVLEFGLLFREAEPWRRFVTDSFWQKNIISSWLNDGTSNPPSATITDPDSISATAPKQHPFLHWKTPPRGYVWRSASEAADDSQDSNLFKALPYSASVQPRGLLLSTRDPSIQKVDFGHFFLLESRCTTAKHCD